MLSLKNKIQQKMWADREIDCLPWQELRQMNLDASPNQAINENETEREKERECLGGKWRELQFTNLDMQNGPSE